MDAITLLNLLLDALLIVLCLGALWIYGCAVDAAIDYLSYNEPADRHFHPPVTVLKSLQGVEHKTCDELYENLASFCQQDYPQYQIVFAVQRLTDPGVEVVQKLTHRFPGLDIKLVVSDRPFSTDPELNDLENAATHAKYDLWLISDPSIRVGQDYLQQIVQPFRYPSVGVVACPYRYVTQGWLAALEGLGAATDRFARVLVARKQQGMPLTAEATLAIRRIVLEKMGGLQAIAHDMISNLQSDFCPAAIGYRIALCNCGVDRVLTTRSLGEFWWRQVSLDQKIGTFHPWNALSRLLPYGTCASLLLLLATGGSLLGWLAVGCTWTFRLGMGWVVGVWALRDRTTERFWWLIPLWDVVSLAIGFSAIFLPVHRSQSQVGLLK